MQVADAGHYYLLHELDVHPDAFGCVQSLTFVKREGEGYPGNVGSHPGTTVQEVLRACINRVKYCEHQIPAPENKETILCLRSAILFLEIRAAKRHGRELKMRAGWDIENDPTCPTCGHVQCEEHNGSDKG